MLLKFHSCRPAIREDTPGHLASPEAQEHLGFCLAHMATSPEICLQRASFKISSLGLWGLCGPWIDHL